MKNSSLIVRTVIIFAVTIIGIYLVIGPRNSFTASDFSWAGIKNNVAENINLGLDLQGGSHLVMRVKTDEYLKALTENNRDAALRAAQELQLPVGEATSVAANNDYQFSLTVTDPNQMEAVVEAVKQKVDVVNNWSESRSGNAVTWSLSLQNQSILKTQATQQAMQIIDSRINEFGVKEPTLQSYGTADSGQILLQMPGLDNPQRVKELIGTSSKLELMKIVSPPNPSPIQTYPTEEAAQQSIAGAPNRRVLEFIDRDDAAPTNPNEPPQRQWVVVETPAVVDGSELRDAAAVQGLGNVGEYQISFYFKPAGAQKFGEWTGKNINNYMGVVLDNKVKSAAFIKSQIFDQGQIDGRFTKESGEDLALTLKSGALPAEIEYQEERTVGPSLGADSIRSGLEASIGGLVLVIIFMFFYYRGSGINAVIALLLNMLLTIAALVVLNSTLTLPGIAGLILGIGMGVDSNVLIFERMREEIRAGKSVAKSIELGFERAFITIVDTNLTIIIAAIILYFFGSGPIRGFAVTLILGLIINLFTAVYVSRTIFMWLLERNPDMKKLSV